MNPQKKGFPQKKINCKVLGKIVGRFMDFCDSYTNFFNVYRYNNVSEHAKNYLAGLLMKAPRKNMERINEYVDGSDYQSYQNFISDSSWDHYALNNQICSIFAGTKSHFFSANTLVKGDASVKQCATS